VRIAIAGAGMAGSYLYRLLREEGFGDADIYGRKNGSACGHRPCAWGFAPSADYRRLVSRFIDPDEHVRDHRKRIEIDGIDMTADVLMVDKPAMNAAMLGDAEVRDGPVPVDRYDRVVDATGIERSYLGHTAHPELIADLIQYRISTPDELGLWISTSAIGYEWCFPMGGGEYHIGFGNLRPGAERHDLLRHLEGREHKVRCRCRSRLRLSSPWYSVPFTNGPMVVGVGESIGTVAPLGGDGNLYSMQCAEMLVRHWDDTAAYTEEVLDRFDWMRREREALQRLMGGTFPSAGDMRTFLQHARRAGFGMGPVSALRFFTKALQSDERANAQMVSR